MEVHISIEQIATALAAAALEKKAFDVAILDIRGLVAYADVFIVCTGRSKRQVVAIAEEVRRKGKELGLRADGIEGLEASRWVLVDLGTVVVHVFDEPMRAFYDLDGLWRDAVKLPVPDVRPAPEPDAAFS